MSASQERYERWEPSADLPQRPMSGVTCVFDADHLTAVAEYASDDAATALRIKFAYVEAFKVYEEFSDPWMETCIPLPPLTNKKAEKWRWPLQEVKNSTWVARVKRRNGALDTDEWRHFVISTMDRTLHVMTSGDPISVKLF